MGLAALAAAAVLSLGAITGACEPPPPPPPIVQVSGIEDAVVYSVNEYRAQYGLAPVSIDVRLTNAAQSHANDMAARELMSHTGSDGSNAGDRIHAQGYGWTNWRENVAFAQTATDRVMTAWMNSPSHRAAILHPDMVNIGVAASYGVDSGYPYWAMELAV
jgi:uncharacterized protein YkwD